MFKDLDALKFSLKVPTIKNHRPLLYLAENAKEGKTLLVSYHRKCHSLLTMKRDYFESISQTTGAKKILELVRKAKRSKSKDLIGKSQARAVLTRIHTIFRKKETVYKRKKTRCFDSVD